MKKREDNKFNNKWMFLVSTIIVALAYFIYIIFRRDGVGGDEAGYIYYARNEFIGDAAILGKPALFYMINHLIFNHSPKIFFARQVFGLYIFYAVLMAFSLNLLARRICRVFEIDNPLPVYGLLCFSPLAFFHGTHLMTETALIICVNFLFAFLLEQEVKVLPSKDKSLLSNIFSVLICIVAIAIKETTLPAIFCILFLMAWRKQDAFKLLLVAAFLGFAVKLGLKVWVGPPSNKAHYLVSLTSPGALIKQLSRLPEYFQAFIFFSSPVALALGLWNLKVGKRSKDWNIKLITLFVIVFFGSMGIAMLSSLPAPRYMFPTVWIGFIAITILAVKEKAWHRNLIILSFSILQINWLQPEPQKMVLWPTMFSDDFYGTGATTFVGVPIFKWAFFKPSLTQSPCVSYNLVNGDMNYYTVRFLSGFTESPRFFDQNDPINDKAYQACTGTKLIVDRRLNIQPSECNSQCPIGSLSACSPHTVVYFSEHQFNHDNPGKLQSGACLYGI